MIYFLNFWISFNFLFERKLKEWCFIQYIYEEMGTSQKYNFS